MYRAAWLLLVFPFLAISYLINPLGHHDPHVTSAPRYVRSLGRHSQNKVTGPVLSSTSRKRINPDEDWEVYFVDGPAYFPIRTAALVLVRFYLEVLEQAVRNEFQQTAPMQNFSYRNGNLRLSFLCRQRPLVSHSLSSASYAYTGSCPYF